MIRHLDSDPDWFSNRKIASQVLQKQRSVVSFSVGASERPLKGEVHCCQAQIQTMLGDSPTFPLPTTFKNFICTPHKINMDPYTSHETSCTHVYPEVLSLAMEKFVCRTLRRRSVSEYRRPDFSQDNRGEVSNKKEGSNELIRIDLGFKEKNRNSWPPATDQISGGYNCTTFLGGGGGPRLPTFTGWMFQDVYKLRQPISGIPKQYVEFTSSGQNYPWSSNPCATKKIQKELTCLCQTRAKKTSRNSLK